MITELRRAEPRDPVSTRHIAEVLDVRPERLSTYLHRWREADVFGAPPAARGTGYPTEWVPRDVVIMAMMLDTVMAAGQSLLGIDARAALAVAIQRAAWGDPMVVATVGPFDIAYEPRWDVLEPQQ